MSLTALLALPVALANPEIAVLGLHEPGRTEEEVQSRTTALLDALGKLGKDVVVIGPDEVARRLAGKEDLVLNDLYLGPGIRQLDEGRLYYDDGEFDKAIESLQKAVQSIKEGMAGARSNKDLLDALLLLGQTHLVNGDEDGARRAFAELAIMDPGLEPDPNRLGESATQSFTEVRDAVLRRGSWPLVIDSAESDLDVYVDGRRIGHPNAGGIPLPPGEHSVLVLASEGRRDFEKVSVGPNKPNLFRPDLEKRLHMETATDEKGRSRQTRALYRAIGEYIQADFVLVAGDNGVETGLQLFATRNRNFSRVVLTGTDPSSDVAELLSFVTPSGDLRSDSVRMEVLPLDVTANPVLTDLLLDPQPGLVRTGPRWYVWTGAGLALAGGTAGVVTVLTTRSEDRGTIVVGPMP